MDWRLCDQCEQDSSTYYCAECELMYCVSCNVKFHSKGTLKGHDVQFLDACLCQNCSCKITTFGCDSCNMKFCDPCWNQWHAKGTLKKHARKLLSAGTNTEVIDAAGNNQDTTLTSGDNTPIPVNLRKISLGYIANPQGERTKYYMSIMKEAHTKMRKPGESDLSFKKRFTAERCRQFDLMQSEQALFKKADDWEKTASDFLCLDYSTKPSDGRRLNHYIQEHKKIKTKLNVMHETTKAHDGSLFTPDGRRLVNGNDFLHAFNEKHLSSMVAKIKKINENLEKLEKQLEVFKRVFKGIHNKHTTTKRRKKENKTKAATRKRNRFQKNIQRVYNLCIKCPIPDLKEFLTYPPNVIVPKHFIDVESVSSELFTRDAQCVVHLLQQPYLSNGAASLVINNLPAKAQEKVFAVLYPEECFNGGGDSDDGSNYEEEPSDSEDNESDSEDNESECEEDIDMDEN